jgi:acyl carrier protein
MEDENNIEIDDEELEEDAEFLTAGQVAEFIAQEFDDNELVHWGVWCKSDVESELGCEITEEQWIRFLRLWTNDFVFNAVRAETFMNAVNVIRQEIAEDAE